MREVEFHRVPETVAVIRNWYSEEELDMVWKELDVICSPFIMYKSGSLGNTSATNEVGADLKKNHGVFLDEFYGNDNRYKSNILNLNRKIFIPDFVLSLIKEDPSFSYFFNCTRDTTLISYYDQDDEYKAHRDDSVYTSNIVLWREPKKFDGGKFLIGTESVDLDIKSNDMVIFPGYSLHTVTEIKMHEDYTEWKSGRYSITNFLSYRY